MNTEKQEQPQEKVEFKLFDPTDSILKVSSRRKPYSYYKICKIIMRKFEHVEIHSLGRASENVVKIA